MQSNISVSVTLILLLLGQFTLAQGKFRFNKEIHDFGNIDEGVVATYEFEFTNVGNQPILIQDISASCGCTTPYYTKEPVLPGQKGVIKVSYNSLGRPYAFTKSVTIRSNADEPIKTLMVKGYVHPKTEAKPKPNAPDLRFDKTVYHAGQLQLGQAVKVSFLMRNNGNKPLEIYRVTTSCTCISYELARKTLAPGETSAIEIIYTPDRLGNALRDYVQLQTNQPDNAFHTLLLTADVIKPNMLREEARPPLGF